MNFIDKVEIKVIAGNGGNGHKSFRHEKFVNKGGPDGGDGGNGGNVIFEVSSNIDTLMNFRFQKELRASDGQEGGKSKKHGKNGQDLIVKVPQGTIVSNNQNKQIVDLTDLSQREIIAAGGKGGFGNAHFVSSVRQAPNFAEKGEPGEELEIILELKLIADIALIGLPNAGKSTLLSRLSNAKPLIADYPFTTLTPNLGVLDLDNKSSVLIADIPGLIEGASKGKGLGIDFLKHIERTNSVIHLIDIYSKNLVRDYKIIRSELSSYSKKLARLKEIIVLNKSEGFSKDELEKIVNKFQKDLKNKTKIIPISAKSGLNLDLLKNEIARMKQRKPKTKPVADKELPIITLNNKMDNSFKIAKIKNRYIVTGDKINSFGNRTDFDDQEALARLKDILLRQGILSSLKIKKIKSGDIIQIGQNPDHFIKY